MFTFMEDIKKFWQYLLLALMLYCQYTSCFPPRGPMRSTSCVEPSQHTLNQQYKEYLSDTETCPHNSWYNLLHLRRSISNETDMDYNIQTQLLSAGDTSCPAEHRPASNELNDLSTCPWFNELNIDCKRYPSGLVQAHCRCSHSNVKHPRGCLGGNDINQGCVELYNIVKVLRKTNNSPANGVCVYQRSYHKIAVGCTCAMLTVSKGPPDM